jgi:hypothetical protein
MDSPSRRAVNKQYWHAGWRWPPAVAIRLPTPERVEQIVKQNAARIAGRLAATLGAPFGSLRPLEPVVHPEPGYRLDDSYQIYGDWEGVTAGA